MFFTNFLIFFKNVFLPFWETLSRRYNITHAVDITGGAYITCPNGQTSFYFIPSGRSFDCAQDDRQRQTSFYPIPSGSCLFTEPKAQHHSRSGHHWRSLHHLPEWANIVLVYPFREILRLRSG